MLEAGEQSASINLGALNPLGRGQKIYFLTPALEPFFGKTLRHIYSLRKKSLSFSAIAFIYYIKYNALKDCDLPLCLNL